MSYIDTHKTIAASWKHHTRTLPGPARVAAPYINQDGHASDRLYDFCLPPEFARLSLLPEVRDRALELFAELGILWHAGIDGGPSNHLLSSQVQCVNALAQMVDAPTRLVEAFSQVIEVGEVLEIEPGRFLTFEYIGPTDFFHEAPNGERTRGAHCTSVDAAFLHRIGKVSELVLVEWKYTESYRRRSSDPERDVIRLARYGQAFDDPRGPVRSNLLPLELLIDEPFYQLVRQQLLAHALESAGVADRVRVVHVLSPHNDGYQASIHRPEQRTFGETVSEVWQKLLARPDRFTSMDPVVFLDPAITSREYVARYIDGVVWNADALLGAFAIDDIRALEDLLDLEVELTLFDEGVGLSMGQDVTVIPFPFTMQEFTELAEAVEEAAEGPLPDGA